MNLPKLQSDLESVSQALHVPADTKVETSDLSIDFENSNGTTEISTLKLVPPYEHMIREFQSS